VRYLLLDCMFCKKLVEKKHYRFKTKGKAYLWLPNMDENKLVL